VASIGGTVVVVAAADEYIQQPQPALPNHSWFGLFAHATHAPALAIAPCAGAQRAATVCNGLRWLLAHQASANDWVLVHDAARCLVLPQQIEQLIAACQTDAVGGLLAQPLADTLKTERQGRSAHTPSRHDKWLAQTPQMFKIGMLLQALEATESQDFDGITDEASAIERQGHAPLLVPSSAHNFKLTYPDDFMLASALLHERTRQHQP
jgi:2-C-methyl-D-erythritol 4-phosphate cytidylyltransferase